MKRKRDTTRDVMGVAFCGFLAGVTLAIVLESYDVLSGLFEEVDPFIYMLTELAALGLGGAMLFAAVAEMRNRFGRTPSRSSHD